MPYIDLVVSHDPDPGLAKALGRGVSERTSGILGKTYEHTAVTVRFVPRTHWIVAGRSLDELGKVSFWLDVKVTAGTTTQSQKAAYLAEIVAFMREELGELHEASYVRVDEVSADAWGFGGHSQRERSVLAKR